MFGAINNIARMLKIARIFARNDALFALEYFRVAPTVLALARLASQQRAKGRPGQRLARALNQAGPSFIKLGQALSTRADIFGDEFSEDLSELQDRLPPFSGAEARKTIEDEFGGALEDLFQEFDDVAVAAASIAQVHFAVTTDGDPVAVKVLRPGVEEAFKRDLMLFRAIARVIERTRSELRRLKPVETVETIAETVELEMNLLFEAAAAAELAENFAGDENFQVPEVDWSRTSQRVLTTERLSGVPLDDRDAIVAAGHDPTEVIEKASIATFKQVFRDGFFHADAHPGNLFVTETGAIGAVDFGIMGRLDLKTRRTLGEILMAFLGRDYRRAAEVHFEAGWVPEHRSVDAFTQACWSIAEPILNKPQSEISIARLLGNLFRITETFQMETQPQLLLLQKTMLVAEGTGRKLAPDVNMWFLTRPLIEAWMKRNLGPEAVICDTVKGVVDTVERLPRILDGIEQSTAMIVEGQVKLNPETVRALRAQHSGGSVLSMLWFIAVALLVVAAMMKWM